MKNFNIFDIISIENKGRRRKYDKAISDLSERLENLTKKISGDYCILTEKIKNLFKQERSNKLSEWREFDLEAATGREFETR